jgi:hypothetical protein
MRLVITATVLITATIAGHSAASTRLTIPGGWYADSVPSGAYVALVKDSHLQTSAGVMTLPPGGNLLYVRLAADGRRFAGVGGTDDHVYEWDGGWHDRGMGFGVNATIYDARDVLRIVWGAGTPTGSQGWRYLNDVGNLVTGDDSYNCRNGLYECTVHGDIVCGQGNDEEGLHCLIRGRRVLVEPGIVRFIRFRRSGDRLALAWVRQDTRSAGLLWLSVDELDALSTYTLPAPKPRPEPNAPPPGPIPSPPTQEPASLKKDVEAERAKVPGLPTKAQLAAMLNAIAWKHRDKGWGLSRKDGGNKCPMPSPAALYIACDILHHKPTNRLYDVFGSSDTKATPMWLKHENPPPASRPWVAPIQPVGSPPDVPTPDPPVANCDALAARITALERELAQAIADKHAQVQRLEAELATALRERDDARAERDALKNQPEPRCTASIFGIKVPCKVIR